VCRRTAGPITVSAARPVGDILKCVADFGTASPVNVPAFHVNHHAREEMPDAVGHISTAVRRRSACDLYVTYRSAKSGRGGGIRTHDPLRPRSWSRALLRRCANDEWSQVSDLKRLDPCHRRTSRPPRCALEPRWKLPRSVFHAGNRTMTPCFKHGSAR
jgi:hypothetical protein